MRPWILIFQEVVVSRVQDGVRSSKRYGRVTYWGGVVLGDVRRSREGENSVSRGLVVIQWGICTCKGSCIVMWGWKTM